MFRAFFFIVAVVVATFLAGLPIIIVGIFYPFARFSRWLARIWCHTVLWCSGTRVKVEGRENVDPQKSYVVVCNHQSHLDAPAVVAHIPLQFTFVAKKELFKIPFFGLVLKSLGIIKIDRGDHDRAVATLREMEATLKRERLSLFAFPEGTRSVDGKIHTFKKGIFILAINTGLPILPASISGTFPILPKKSLRIHPGKAQITIHPPVATDEYSLDDKESLIDKIHQIVEDGIRGQSESV